MVANMPNHCTNELIISGPQSRVFDFCRDHYRNPPSWNPLEAPEDHKTVLDFSVCVPYPDERADNDDWYNWRISNWGTKWNAYDISLLTFPEVIESVAVCKSTDTANVTYHFHTAWSPPVPWLKAASRIYPELTFALGWEEQGCDYYGAVVSQRGKEIAYREGRCSDYCSDDVDWDDTDASQEAWFHQSERLWEKIREITKKDLTSA